jgi:thymidylate synthase (FAD)
MRVELLTYTPNPLRVLFTAAHGCYSELDPAEIYRIGGAAALKEGTRLTPEQKELGVVRGCIEKNHNSVMRHVNFTFSIAGISRACSHQFVRHGAGTSFDQQSQRYVRLTTEPEWVLPAKGAAQIRAAARAAWFHYKDMLADKIPAEDARAILPNCTPTNMTATFNLAALMHFYGVRFKGDTGKPQDEIKSLAAEMVRRVVQAEPWLTEFFPEVADG